MLVASGYNPTTTESRGVVCRCRTVGPPALFVSKVNPYLTTYLSRPLTRIIIEHVRVALT